MQTHRSRNVGLYMVGPSIRRTLSGLSGVLTWTIPSHAAKPAVAVLLVATLLAYLLGFVGFSIP